MANRLKYRIDNIAEKANSTEYARIEDLLRILELERKPELTEAEQAQIDELRKMPIDPKLEKALSEIISSRVTV